MLHVLPQGIAVSVLAPHRGKEFILPLQRFLERQVSGSHHAKLDSSHNLGSSFDPLADPLQCLFLSVLLVPQNMTREARPSRFGRA